MSDTTGSYAAIMMAVFALILVATASVAALRLFSRRQKEEATILRRFSRERIAGRGGR
ncbi:MAG: hypothetical protein ABI882_13670 [Acidobacteriota bacterium]